MSSTTAFVSIDNLCKGRQAVSAPIDTGGGCGTTGGEGKASCGSSDGPDDMPQEIVQPVELVVRASSGGALRETVPAGR